MPRKALDRELERIDRDLGEMAELVSVSVEKAMEALEKRDLQLAKEVIIEDDLINEYENQVKRRCIQTIALQQPVAKDLRIISVSMDVAYNLERIGDFATDIARSLEYMEEDYVVPREILEMGKIDAQIVKEAGDAFINEKKGKIGSVMEMEDHVDELYKATFPVLRGRIDACKEDGSSALNLMLIAKFLERIADHSVNIANRALYEIYGKDEYL